jgi:hypothetical protein
LALWVAFAEQQVEVNKTLDPTNQQGWRSAAFKQALSSPERLEGRTVA